MATKEETLLDVKDLKKHLDSGKPATILDVRSEKAFEASDQRITGDIRVPPDQFDVGSGWPRERLTVAY